MARRILRPQPSYDEALFVRTPQGHWHRWDVDPFVPQGVAVGVSTPAFVNHGRWVVRCPFCAGAQLAHPDRTDRFFCIDCLNDLAGRQWISVTWPDDVSAIESVLELRPEVTTRSWWPHETVEDLRAENIAHGVDA
jgi:hypothetical protein